MSKISRIKSEIRSRYIKEDINITDLAKDYEYARTTIGKWLKDLKVEKDKKLSLALKYPEIASEWHPTKNGSKTPLDFKFASNKKVWWLCNSATFGVQHEYYKKIEARTLKGQNCKLCINRGGLSPQKDNSLFATFNQLVSEIHAANEDDKRDIALETTYFDTEKLEWDCNHGLDHTYLMSPRDRTFGFEWG